MSLQSEKSALIEVLEKIDDVSVIQKVKDFLFLETTANKLSESQKTELDNRLLHHNKNPYDGHDAFEFLDSLKLKYEL